MSAVERTSGASRAEQANECAMQANKRMEERKAQYSTRRFQNHFTQCAEGLITEDIYTRIFWEGEM